LSDEIISRAVLLDDRTNYAAIVQFRILIRAALCLSDLRSPSVQYFVPVENEYITVALNGYEKLRLSE